MITTLTGANHYALQAEHSKIVQSFLSQHSEIGLEQFDGAELELGTLLSALQAVPFLDTKRLVIARELSINKNLSEQIDKILGSIIDTTDLLLVEPKLDKRTAYYKTLKKQTDFQEFSELDERQLTQWLVGEAKARGGSMNTAAAQYLMQRTGANQLLLSNELNKLLNYEPEITRDSIKALVQPSPQSSIFTLLDAAFAGDNARAISLYRDQRAQRIEPLQIVAMLAWQLHILALVKTAGSRTSSDIAKEAKLNPFVVQKSQSLARRFSLNQLKKMVTITLELDIKLKSQAIDPDEALEYFLLSINQ